MILKCAFYICLTKLIYEDEILINYCVKSRSSYYYKEFPLILFFLLIQKDHLNLVLKLLNSGPWLYHLLK